MTLLPVNMVLPRQLRGRLQFGLTVLPIGLALASFWPLWMFATWFAVLLGIPVDAPVRDQENGGLWLVVVLVGMVCFVLAGYFFGWLLNALIARYLLGWPRPQVEAVFLRSEIPQHWYRQDNATDASANPEFGSKAGWEGLRKGGPWRFIVFRGIFRFGAILFFGIAVVPALTSGSTDAHYWLTQGLVCVLAGLLFGACIWYFSESQYKKLKQAEDEKH